MVLGATVLCATMLSAAVMAAAVVTATVVTATVVSTTMVRSTVVSATMLRLVPSAVGTGVGMMRWGRVAEVRNRRDRALREGLGASNRVRSGAAIWSADVLLDLFANEVAAVRDRRNRWQMGGQ